MGLQRYLLQIGVLGVLSSVGCASSPHKVADESQPRTSYTEESEGQSITSAAAREAKAHDFVEIKFDQGSAALSDSAQSSLKSVIDQARQDNKIAEVIVLSWSDEEFPSKATGKLPKSQTQLAENRNKAIENYLKTMRAYDVDSYNMAEQPNILSKWFNTTDNKLKNSLVEAGLPTTADDPQYPSKASHSVVLVKVE